VGGKKGKGGAKANEKRGAIKKEGKNRMKMNNIIKKPVRRRGKRELL